MDEGFDEERAEAVIQALRVWASSHPGPNEPFFMTMSMSEWYGEGPRHEAFRNYLTPKQFLQEVENRTALGKQFLQFVFEQADRFDVRPDVFVWRAVEANKRPDLEPER